MKKLIFALVAILLILLLTTRLTPTPSAEVVAEWQLGEISAGWQSGEIISSAIAGEIDGKSYLFLATAPNSPMPHELWLRVVDIQSPESPREVGSLKAPVDVMWPGFGISLSDDVIYLPLGGSDDGLWVVDVSDPTSPQEITLFSTGDDVYSVDLAVSGNYACLATFSPRNILLIDISDPAHPEQVGSLHLDIPFEASSSKRLEFVDSLLLVVYRSGLNIVDVSSPAQPQEVGFFANPDWIDEPTDHPFELLAPQDSFIDVAVSGDFAYIAASNLGLIVLDISNPASPSKVAQLDTPDRAVRVAISNNLVYLLEINLSSGSFSYVLEIVDVSEPDNPRTVDSTELTTMLPTYLSLVEAGDYIYFLNLDTVVVIDVYA